MKVLRKGERLQNWKYMGYFKKVNGLLLFLGIKLITEYVKLYGVFGNGIPAYGVAHPEHEIFRKYYFGTGTDNRRMKTVDLESCAICKI